MGWLRFWAPRAEAVEVQVAGTSRAAAVDLERPGWFEIVDEELRHGTDYRLVLDGAVVTDPLARWLPDGVHGDARYFDPTAFSWSDAAWQPVAPGPLGATSVLYELHVGTFTAEGTLDAAAGHLEHVRDLGVSHVELMPLAAFDGRHGWGYDGVAVNAVHEPYGGPEALCRFVDRAHALGLAVLLDLVHNHIGPSGNYWDRFGPFFTDRYGTPWGSAINLDGPGSDDVRHILMSCSLGWLRDFHLDGLRLDAVHELHDARAHSYLEELTDAVAALAEETGRPLATIAESDRNDPRTVTPTRDGGTGLTAQWDDDVHHALHWLLTGEDQGYYADFASVEAVSHAVEHAFWHDGRMSTFRGRVHGRPVDFTRTPTTRFVASLQTHDQVGNRAGGERLSQLVPMERLFAGAALLLAMPYVPMLFMGEEWGAGTPFLFFSSFDDPELAAAVTAGRRAEFAEHGWGAEVPDPQDPATRSRSVLDWQEATSGWHADLVGWYRDLIVWRRRNPSVGAPKVDAAVGADGRPTWFAVTTGTRTAVASLSDEPLTVDGRWASGPGSLDLSWPPSGAELIDESVHLTPGATALLRGWLPSR
jgi:maltooligosyltrehalose trehalohydrolase